MHDNREPLRIDKVGRRFGDVDIIKDLTFDVVDGRVNVIVGPSGCGKSTIINMLAGFDMPSEGVITIDGKRVSGPGRDRLVVFQESALFPWMKIRANVLFGPRSNKASRLTAGALNDLLRTVGLQGFDSKYPSQLSGGMQRRAEVARALINTPRFMMLDEPFRGLDALTRELMWEYYNELLEANKMTTLFVTTNIDEAIFLADRLIILTNTPAQVRDIIDINLERPRTLKKTMKEAAFKNYRAVVLKMLYEESEKSFADRSDAAVDFLNALEQHL